MRRALLSTLSLLALLTTATGFITHRSAAHATAALQRAVKPIELRGMQLPARVSGTRVELATATGFKSRFWAGVNLGATVPGHLPGELAATRADYGRWLNGMAALGLHLVRIYTILNPAFYAALFSYDRQHPSSPIFVIQGVWAPDDVLARVGDAYDRAVTEGFELSLREAVAVVHGRATLPASPGRASGLFNRDISRWVLAYAIGVEWGPQAVAATDRRHAGEAPFRGRYFAASPQTTPMESWLARMLDYTAGLEAARGWSRPLTFVNWLTLDPLRHPYEPLPNEDLVSVDATHIHATTAWPGGFFASYHAYPYYPDFLRYTPQYQQYRRPRDHRPDPYAGYLHQLRQYHRSQAVMILEFGVPSGPGSAHVGPAGRDQGNHSEQQMGAMDASMLRDIHDEGFAGGVLFEWVDEWFKATWNTIPFQIPADRRQFWDDVMTNEQHFGIIAAEPGAREPVIVDGRGGEWARNDSAVLATSKGPVREVRATHDAAYLYLLLRLKNPEIWSHGRMTVGFDVRPGGNGGLPGTNGIDPAADVALQIGPGKQAVIEQAAWTDPVTREYGVGGGTPPAGELAPGGGLWVEPRLVLDRALVIPATGEHRGLEALSIGRLPWGTTNPSSPAFDSRNMVDAAGSVIEVRIPWHDLTFSDPSSHQVYVPHPDWTTTSETVGGVGIQVVTATGEVTATRRYSWKRWEAVAWHERRKAGWNAIKAAVAAVQ